MVAPVARLKKQHLVWLTNHYCQHRQPYLVHYQCYLKEQPQNDRLGFLDIEASNLRADFGFLLSYCIKEHGGKIWQNRLTQDDIEQSAIGKEDKNLIEALVQDLRRFDRVVSFYGVGFDMKFMRTRAVINGVPYPKYAEITHQDIYFLVRNRFSLSSNRQENACRVLLGRTEKTHINGAYWRAASRGNEKALKWILDHNRRDVRDLEKLYDCVHEYGAPKAQSI